MHTKNAEQYFGKAQVYLHKKVIHEFIEDNPNSPIFPRAMIVSALDHTLIITGYIFISIENLAQVALNLLGVMFNFLSYFWWYNGYQFDCSFGDAVVSLETALHTAAWVPIRTGLLPITWIIQSAKIVEKPKEAYLDIRDN